jgi:hypothetical protein
MSSPENEKNEAIEQNKSKSDSSEPDFLDTVIVSKLIERPAATDQEIADELGVSRQTISRRKNGPGVKKMLRATLLVPESLVRRMIIKSLDRLEYLLDDPDPKIRLTVSLAFLRLGSDFVTRDDEF